MAISSHPEPMLHCGESHSSGGYYAESQMSFIEPGMDCQETVTNY